MSITYLECMRKFLKKKLYIPDLYDVFNNPTKLQLNQIRTLKKSQLKLFNTAVTLKQTEGH